MSLVRTAKQYDHPSVPVNVALVAVVAERQIEAVKAPPVQGHRSSRTSYVDTGYPGRALHVISALGVNCQPASGPISAVGV